MIIKLVLTNLMVSLSLCASYNSAELTELDETPRTHLEVEDKDETNLRFAPYTNYYQKLLSRNEGLSSESREQLENALILADSITTICQRIKTAPVYTEAIAQEHYRKVAQLAKELASLQARAEEKGIFAVTLFIRFLKERDCVDHVFFDCYSYAVGRALGSIELSIAKPEKLNQLMDDLKHWAYLVRCPHSDSRKFELYEAIGIMKGHLYHLEKNKMIESEPASKKSRADQ